ncbi:CHAT domain-containing protein [Streptomyces sp. 3MP-14]|uniref:CHAT domain-containing protein n=1 Tax=Streptomyces mimosae TaxID=2586635 RepID=A0A5N6ACI0_9ACTN|nr:MULTISPECIES: CHAT domain-containing protein [Streptomyces]KAB8166361.1 CHAT domain-containing protein [Streptomyces mimosae]KAB8174154.1 CHAT domain-containing protein [Streptomyces sp. 3MP-14]
MDAEVVRALEAADRLLPATGAGLAGAGPSAEGAGPSAEGAGPGAEGAGAGPKEGAGPRPDLDATVARLARAERELGGGDEPGAALLWARLGGLYGRRYLLGVGTEADREEGTRLLRAARAVAGPGALDERERVRATWVLAALRLPMPQPGPGPGLEGWIPDAERIIAWGMRPTRHTRQILAEAAEAEALLRELEAARLPEPLPKEVARLRSTLALMRTLLGAGDLPGFVNLMDRLLRERPELTAVRPLLQGMLSMVRGHPALAQPPALEPAPAPALEPAPASAAKEPDEPDPTEVAALAMLAEIGAPGAVGTARLRELVETLRPAPGGSGDPARDAINLSLRAMGDAMLALRTGETDRVDRAYAGLRRAAAQLPPDHELATLLASLSGLIPSVATITRGNLRDEEATARVLGALNPEPLWDAPALSGPPHARRLAVLSRTLVLGLRLRRLWGESDAPAERGGWGGWAASDGPGGSDGAGGPGGSGTPDEAAIVDACVAELRALLAQVDRRDLVYPHVAAHLAVAHALRAWMRASVRDLRAALRLVEEIRADEATLPFVRQLFDSGWPLILAGSPTLKRDPDLILQAVAASRAALDSVESSLVNQRAMTLRNIAEALLTHHELTGDRRSLDEAVTESRRARAALVARADSAGTRDVLWTLARAHARRADRGLGDLRIAVEAGRLALRVVSDDVLMQVGAEHGLETARHGADRALRVAGWALAADDAAGAVRSLEVGRALVLRAAAVAEGVPERLAALGKGELAEEWRRAASAPAPEAEMGVGAGPTVPSRLRRLALDALRAAPGGPDELAAVPEPAELGAAVAASGADALVYLVPGLDGRDGAALLVRGPWKPVVALPLPGLSAAGRRPLEAYLTAAARRSGQRRAREAEAPEAEAGWEAALEELCAWAGPAVVGPLLARLAADGARRAPVRLVLVPCGNLGVVPWHAARLAGGHACEVAVFSYAASGAQFLEAAGRARRPVRERPVLVADPRLDLLWAADEVLTLRAAHYQRAALYGEFVTGRPPGGTSGAGTPEELLALLPGAEGGANGAGPASLLHIASHGEAGARPTVSALALAGTGGDETGDGGLLTVTRLLDRPGGGPAPGEPGPLVVLSACETDLSRRDHDEALTLTTALVARGATDAVGSRWTTGDGASALMMVVFHHQLAVEGLAPADALRAAQLWMLDPERRPPPGMDGQLAREARRPSLERVAEWAAFVHQGSPRPNPRRGPATKPSTAPPTNSATDSATDSATNSGKDEGR